MNINTSHWQIWSLGLPWPPGQPWPSGPTWQPGPPGAPGAPWLTNHLDQLNHSGNPEGWKYLSGRKKQKSHFLIGLVLVRIFSVSYSILLHPESSSIVWKDLRWLQHKNHLLDHILFLETFCCCWRVKLSSLFETNQKRRKSNAQSASSAGGQYRTGKKHKITKSTTGKDGGLKTVCNQPQKLGISFWLDDESNSL